MRAIGAHEPRSLERIDVALYDDAIFAAYVAAAAELATVEQEAADGTRTFRLAGAPTAARTPANNAAPAGAEASS